MGLGLGVFGFFMGVLHQESKPLPINYVPVEKISEIKLEKLDGDTLEAVVVGKGRILLENEVIQEGKGILRVPLAAIPNEEDLIFTEFRYTGNAKSKKVYLTDSYHGRGVDPAVRRRFKDLETAIKEGFEPRRGVE